MNFQPNKIKIFLSVLITFIILYFFDGFGCPVGVKYCLKTPLAFWKNYWGEMSELSIIFLGPLTLGILIGVYVIWSFIEKK